jgi:hypothetical protein
MGTDGIASRSCSSHSGSWAGWEVLVLGERGEFSSCGMEGSEEDEDEEDVPDKRFVTNALSLLSFLRK